MDTVSFRNFQAQPMASDATRVVKPLPIRREPDRPAGDLSKLVGQDNYYLERKKDFEKRHPGLKAPDYYQDYGNKYLQRFKYDLRPKLSTEGKQWVDKTLVGLQRKIEEKRAADPVAFDRLERDPDAFRKFCFDSHPSAYLEGGLNTLSVKEQAMIAATPDAGDLFSLGGLEQAVETGGRLVGDYVTHPEKFVVPNLREVQRAVYPQSQQAPVRSQPLQRPLMPIPLGQSIPYGYPGLGSPLNGNALKPLLPTTGYFR